MVPGPSVLEVLHEDDDLLVVNKPAGLVCHPTRDGELSSLIGRVRLHLGHSEGRLVNRLDRETSGVVLLAKRAAVAKELGRLFSRTAIVKHYWAIVHGHVQGRTLSIDAPLGKDESSAVAIKDIVRHDGAQARTAVEVLAAFDHHGAPVTWLLVTPATGRKHQIRIHLSHIGHPVVGDKIYGGDERVYLRFVSNTLTEDDRRALLVTNHALHARRLAFIWRERAYDFTAEPGDEWEAWRGAMLTACRT